MYTNTILSFRTEVFKTHNVCRLKVYFKLYYEGQPITLTWLVVHDYHVWCSKKDVQHIIMYIYSGSTSGEAVTLIV